MTQVYALKITQRSADGEGEPVALYVTALSLKDLRLHTQVDRWSPANVEGYQRPPVDRRLRDVAKYVTEEYGILPTSVLLGTRSDDREPIEFVAREDSDGTGEWGLLTVPDAAKLWLVDGQHRYFGVNHAYERGGLEALDSYPFPVTIMANVDRYMEMVHFNLINTRQRKMPTDIVDRHLVLRQEHEGLKMIASGKRGEKEYLQATATRIVDLLNEEPGPWYHQIAIPGVPGRDQGLLRQHALVASLEPVMKDSWVRAQRPLEDHVVKLITNYWGALSDTWPEAFAEPQVYRIQATVGVYSMHLVLPVLIQRCLAERDLSRAKMREIVGATAIKSEFWHKEYGDPYTLGTGMASIRALAQYIIGELPTTLSPAPVKM